MITDWKLKIPAVQMAYISANFGRSIIDPEGFGYLYNAGIFIGGISHRLYLGSSGRLRKGH